MGLLDDLEQAAQQRKLEQDEQARLKDERDRVYRTELEPAMQALQDFLGRLTKSLTELKPERIQEYDLPPYGTVVAAVVHEYKLTGSASAIAREIRLEFAANVLTERCPLVDAQGVVRVKAVTAALQKARLGGTGNARKDGNGEVVQASFRAKGKIPLTVHWQADAASGQVKATFSNFQDFSQFTKVYAPAQFNQELFEVFARYITREDNGLTQEAIPDRLRQHLRTKVQQEEIKRKWEEKLYQQQQEELRQREEDSKLGLRLKKQGEALLDKLKTGIGGLIARTRKPK